MARRSRCSRKDIFYRRTWLIMTKCKSLIGWFFGHNFKPFQSDGKKTYSIKCTRCGKIVKGLELKEWFGA